MGAEIPPSFPPSPLPSPLPPEQGRGLRECAAEWCAVGTRVRRTALTSLVSATSAANPFFSAAPSPARSPGACRAARRASCSARTHHGPLFVVRRGGRRRGDRAVAGPALRPVPSSPRHLQEPGANGSLRTPESREHVLYEHGAAVPRERGASHRLLPLRAVEVRPQPAQPARPARRRGPRLRQPRPRHVDRLRALALALQLQARDQRVRPQLLWPPAARRARVPRLPPRRPPRRPQPSRAPSHCRPHQRDPSPECALRRRICSGPGPAGCARDCGARRSVPPQRRSRRQVGAEPLAGARPGTRRSPRARGPRGTASLARALAAQPERGRRPLPRPTPVLRPLHRVRLLECQVRSVRVPLSRACQPNHKHGRSEWG